MESLWIREAPQDVGSSAIEAGAAAAQSSCAACVACQLTACQRASRQTNTPLFR